MFCVMEHHNLRRQTIHGIDFVTVRGNGLFIQHMLKRIIEYNSNGLVMIMS